MLEHTRGSERIPVCIVSDLILQQRLPKWTCSPGGVGCPFRTTHALAAAMKTCAARHPPSAPTDTPPNHDTIHSSSIQFPASSHLRPASPIPHPVSSHLHLASCIQHPASSFFHPASRIHSTCIPHPSSSILHPASLRLNDDAVPAQEFSRPSRFPDSHTSRRPTQSSEPTTTRPASVLSSTSPANLAETRGRNKIYPPVVGLSGA